MKVEKSKEISDTLETLLIVFIVLKLTNNINWSWWWVLSPFWIPCIIGVVILGIVWLWLYIKHMTHLVL